MRYFRHKGRLILLNLKRRRRQIRRIRFKKDSIAWNIFYHRVCCRPIVGNYAAKTEIKLAQSQGTVHLFFTPAKAMKDSTNLAAVSNLSLLKNRENFFETIANVKRNGQTPFNAPIYLLMQCIDLNIEGALIPIQVQPYLPNGTETRWILEVFRFERVQLVLVVFLYVTWMQADHLANGKRWELVHCSSHFFHAMYINVG